MYLKQIETVLKSNWTQYGKFRVELAFHGQEKKVFWLSEKQMDKLKGCFDRTPRGYSCAKIVVCGVFEEGQAGKEDRFVWSGIHSAKRSELDFLCDKFGVVCDGIVDMQDQFPPVLETPETVEVPDELKDDE